MPTTPYSVLIYSYGFITYAARFRLTAGLYYSEYYPGFKCARFIKFSTRVDATLVSASLEHRPGSPSFIPPRLPPPAEDRNSGTVRLADDCLCGDRDDLIAVGLADCSHPHVEPSLWWLHPRQLILLCQKIDCLILCRTLARLGALPYPPQGTLQPTACTTH